MLNKMASDVIDNITFYKIVLRHIKYLSSIWLIKLNFFGLSGDPTPLLSGLSSTASNTILTLGSRAFEHISAIHILWERINPRTGSEGSRERVMF